MTPSPNKKHDGLKIAQGLIQSILIYKTENTQKEMFLSLPSLCRNNGIDSSGAHSALYDSILVQQILKLTKQKQPETWDLFLRTSSKSQWKQLLKKRKFLHFKKLILESSISFWLHPSS